MTTEQRMEFLNDIYRVYPKCVHVDFLGIKILLAYHPRIVQRIFTLQQTMQRPFSSFVPIQKGLLFASYNTWREPRKHLNIAFNLNVLKGFIPIFSSYTDLAVRDMQTHANAGEFNVLPFIGQLTLRTVSATLLNVHRIELSSFQKIQDSINTMSESLFDRITNPLLHSDFIYEMTKGHKRGKAAIDFLMQYGNELIDEARKRNKISQLSAADENKNTNEEDTSGANRPKIHFIVDQLINHEEKYSDQEIRDQLLTLLVTASDTTTNLVGACLMYLAIHQDIQQRAYDEIVDVFSEVDEDIDYEKLNELKYLEMILKETLRLFTPVSTMMREAHEDCDVGSGKTLRKGTKIFIMNYVLHQRKDIWGEHARKFDPENFSLDNPNDRDSYSFIPFGSGQRNCIGNRYTMIAAKVFVSKILRAYKFETILTESDMKLRMNFTSKLKSDYLVTIAKR